MVHYDYGVSARRRVTPAQLDEILHIIRDAPKPILVHCQAGADRTGVVSAVYLFSHGKPPDEADGALSLRYATSPGWGAGHGRWMRASTPMSRLRRDRRGRRERRLPLPVPRARRQALCEVQGVRGVEVGRGFTGATFTGGMLTRLRRVVAGVWLGRRLAERVRNR